MTITSRERADLVTCYGDPRPVNTADALRRIGKRDEVHPYDAFACIYRDDEAVDAFLAANRKEGMESLGRTPVEDGVLAVTDIRPSLRRLAGHAAVHDPALPDDYRSTPAARTRPT